MTAPSPKVFVVVPTYWGPSARAIYDHPTPLDGESTLPRLLESLVVQHDAPPFRLMVLASAVSPEYETAAAERVASLLSPYHGRLDLMTVDGQTAARVRDRLLALGFDPTLASLRGYASVRNLQLLVPAILGAEVVVALDDDEVVAPGYLHRASEWIGRSHAGRAITGLAGSYLDAEGSPYLPEKPESGNVFADKPVYMNRAFRRLEAGGGLVETPLALGGNMVFHRALFTRVGFDPGITRGEDIDYLINARLAGHTFYYDRQLTITHLPPRHYEASAYGKTRQDVFRFLYEREKLRLGGLSPEAFDPYPGRLLRQDVRQQARDALAQLASPEGVAQFGSPETIVADAVRHAEAHAPRYRDFARRWPQLVVALAGDSAPGVVVARS